MISRARGLLICGFLLLAVASLPNAARATEMETVSIAPDGKGFLLHPSGDRYIPWGHNYASVDIMERLATDPVRVARDFTDMKSAGTTVARVHPEMLRILDGAESANAEALDRLRTLLKIQVS